MAEVPLIDAENLFRQPGPALSAARAIAPLFKMAISAVIFAPPYRGSFMGNLCALFALTFSAPRTTTLIASSPEFTCRYYIT
jgi:hypothetical protein